MPAPIDAGKYHASVLEAVVSEKGKNNLAVLSLHLGLTELLDSDGTWADVRPYQYEIIHDHYLEKGPDKGGGPIENNIKSVKEAFGWDGFDFEWLEKTPLRDCQVTLEWQTYTSKKNGQEYTNLRVQWLNAYDDDRTDGDMPHSDDEARKRIRARLGAPLRALAGPSAAPAVAPARRQAPPRTAAPVKTEDSVYSVFKQQADRQGLSAHDRNALWSKEMDAITPGIPTPAEYELLEAALTEALLALQPEPEAAAGGAGGAPWSAYENEREPEELPEA